MLVAEANGILGLVEDAVASGTMNLAVLGTAELVPDLLTGRLLLVGLSAAGIALVMINKNRWSHPYRASLSPVSVKASLTLV